MNVPDHDRMFAQLAQSLRSGGQRVASLRSKDCKMMLKPIIKSLVVQFIGTNPAFSLKEGKVFHFAWVCAVLLPTFFVRRLRCAPSSTGTRLRDGSTSSPRSPSRLRLPPLRRGKTPSKNYYYYFCSSLHTERDTLHGFYFSMEVEGANDDGCEPPLVVVIEDFEAFDADVLKELISILR